MVSVSLGQAASLERLLEHPGIWRGRSTALTDTLATGFPELDAALPGGGWPLSGLIEILTPRSGLGELRLLVPLLHRLGQQSPARWVAWIAPPFEPYAPALAARGVPPERQLVVRTTVSPWATELALDSGACAAVLAWAGRVPAQDLRRLQLATQRGRTPGFLFRSLDTVGEASPAQLRLVFEPFPSGASVRLIKSRGGARAPVVLHWPEAGPEPECDGPA
jgi:cell division inhibitor SulA/protein ImuA